ncbi:MAG: hypothetical protein FJ279_27970 [Planctomycetes bacterium]|nr:hypothetical protein [Planctomycetota bacterium]
MGKDLKTQELLWTGRAWEGHRLFFYWSLPPYTDPLLPTDIDHCCENKHHKDEVETGFTCTWALSKVTEAGTLVPYGDLGSACGGTVWVTDNEDPIMYVVEAVVDDRREGAAKGNDPPKRAAFTVVLVEPSVIKFERMTGYPHDNRDGVLHFKYKWESSCGHPECLDNSTVREYVDYERSGGRGQDDGTNWERWPQEAWNEEYYADKSKGIAAVDCEGGDSHSKGPLREGWLISNVPPPVKAMQRYEWAYWIPGAPSDTVDEFPNSPPPHTSGGWLLLRGPQPIVRRVEWDGAAWVYYITKENVESVPYTIPWQY